MERGSKTVGCSEWQMGNDLNGQGCIDGICGIVQQSHPRLRIPPPPPSHPTSQPPITLEELRSNPPALVHDERGAIFRFSGPLDPAQLVVLHTTLGRSPMNCTPARYLSAGLSNVCPEKSSSPGASSAATSSGTSSRKLNACSTPMPSGGSNRI